MTECYHCGNPDLEIKEFTRRKVWNSVAQEFVKEDAPRQYCSMCGRWGDYARNLNFVKKIVNTNAEPGA